MTNARGLLLRRFFGGFLGLRLLGLLGLRGLRSRACLVRNDLGAFGLRGALVDVSELHAALHSAILRVGREAKPHRGRCSSSLLLAFSFANVHGADDKSGSGGGDDGSISKTSKFHFFLPRVEIAIVEEGSKKLQEI